MPDLLDGETLQVKGSAASPYVLKNVGGVYSCSCPAWRNQSTPPERRTCKHLRALRGADLEAERLGQAMEASGPGPAAPSVPAEPSKVPPLLLAQRWDNLQELAGWWMSEKLDGVRAYWDGERLISRLGNPFHAPRWFTDSFPSHPLDGELWGGRQQFQRTVSVVRRQDQSREWESIAYLVFDAPSHPGPFEERLASLGQVLGSRFLSLHDHQPCQGVDHLRQELARVEAQGGEGLMLRQPGSAYEVGRSWTLLKVKNFHDAEARVVGHQPGAGRHQGRLGALLVQLEDGTRFSVGTGFSDAEREGPPAVGSTITFRYQELSTAGVPRFPSYVGERCDVEIKSRPARVVSGSGLGELLVEARQRAREGDLQALPQLIEQLCRLAGVPEPADAPQPLPGPAAVSPARQAATPPGPAAVSPGPQPASPAGTPAGPQPVLPVATAPGPAAVSPGPQPVPYAASPPEPPAVPQPPSAATSPGPAAVSPAPQPVASPAAATAATPSAPAGKARRLEFVGGGSAKFWEIEVDGSQYTARWGRLGSAGQAKTKLFDSPAQASREALQLAQEKLARGYREV